MSNDSKTFRIDYDITEEGYIEFATKSEMMKALTELQDRESSIEDASNPEHWLYKAVTYHKRYDGSQEFEADEVES